MTSFRYVAVLAAIIVAAGVWPLSISGQAIAQASNLRIVVISGEDAVNIIQQKTAVAPIVEVRDRNDQPVAGAIVRFAVQGGRATFGGAQTLTVTTNAVGQAVATGLTPTASGALQISATAAFQGQTAAAVTIAQTNVMTAAQATAVSSAAGTSGGGASGAGAGGAGGGSSGSAAGTGAAGGAGGGGLSATTIGILGAAAAGGAVVATKALGENGLTTLTGTYSGQIVMSTVTATGQPGCSFIETLSGTVKITLDDPDTGAGSVEVSEQHSITSGNCGNIGGGANDTATGPLSGSPANLTFAVQKTNPLPNNGQRTKPWSFSGQLNGNEITGVLTTGDINANANGAVTATGSSSIPITLR
jgi:hypothetical protein